MLGSTEKQRGNAQTLRGGAHSGAHQPLVQVFDEALIEVRHWHGREYTRRSPAGNEKRRISSSFAPWFTGIPAAKSRDENQAWKPRRHADRVVFRTRRGGDTRRARRARPALRRAQRSHARCRAGSAYGAAADPYQLHHPIAPRRVL